MRLKGKLAHRTWLSRQYISILFLAYISEFLIVSSQDQRSGPAPKKSVPEPQKSVICDHHCMSKSLKLLPEIMRSLHLYYTMSHLHYWDLETSCILFITDRVTTHILLWCFNSIHNKLLYAQYFDLPTFAILAIDEHGYNLVLPYKLPLQLWIWSTHVLSDRSQTTVLHSNLNILHIHRCAKYCYNDCEENSVPFYQLWQCSWKAYIDRQTAMISETKFKCKSDLQYSHHCSKALSPSRDGQKVSGPHDLAHQAAANAQMNTKRSPLIKQSERKLY